MRTPEATVFQCGKSYVRWPHAAREAFLLNNFKYTIMHVYKKGTQSPMIFPKHFSTGGNIVQKSSCRPCYARFSAHFSAPSRVYVLAARLPGGRKVLWPNDQTLLFLLRAYA